MQTSGRIEGTLERAIGLAQGAGAPPLLASAMHYAVFPGGHRIRPQLCLAVSMACGDAHPAAADAAAAAIELLHCASLVHDDLPCFDDADTRRGKPSVHAQFGAPLAVLTGDALIVMAFETLAREVSARSAADLPGSFRSSLRRSARPAGIVAGQAWECEAAVPLADYQRAKTGALFVGATLAGALPRAHNPEPWRAFGEMLGEAYQVADDLRDVLCDADELGKPIGQDAMRYRPNAAAQLGIGGAKSHLEGLVQAAIESIPPCPGRAELRALIKDADPAVLSRGVGPRGRLKPRLHKEGADVRPCRSARVSPCLGLGIASGRGGIAFSPTPASSGGRPRSPLTRKLAQRRARALFDLCAGFVYSQILFACVKLDVFELLRDGPRDCQALAPRMGLTVAAARRLLMASGVPRPPARPARRSIRARRSRRVDARQSRDRCVRRSPRSALRRPQRPHRDCLRGEAETRLSRFWPYASRRPDGGSEAVDAPGVGGEVYGAYSDLMSQTQMLVAEEILDAYPFARHRRLLDVGGGEGAFVAAAAKRAPHLELELFDLPPVAARAGAKLAALGLSDRVEATGGDCLSDPLPRGADIVSLVRVLHDHDDELALVLLGAAHDALPRGGAVLVAEPMARDARGRTDGRRLFRHSISWPWGAGARARPARSPPSCTRPDFDRAHMLKTRNPLLVSAVAARRV